MAAPRQEAVQLVQGCIGEAGDLVRPFIRSRKVSDRTIICNFEEAVEWKFSDLLGKVLAFLKDERAKEIVLDNLRDETLQDHVDMLLRFAASCGAFPDRRHKKHVAPALTRVRRLMTDKRSNGLVGLMILALLENLSLAFIPDLGERGRRCGCTDFQFIEVHGAADIKHSCELVEAVARELEHYDNVEALLKLATDATVEFIICIWSSPRSKPLAS